jgi:hypothetical protein
VELCVGFLGALEIAVEGLVVEGVAVDFSLTPEIE